MNILKRKDVLNELSGREMLMGELVEALHKSHTGLDEDEIKSVILPLLASREIILTSHRKLVIPAGATVSV